MTVKYPDFVAEHVGTQELALYLTADSGDRFGIYPDGSVSVGDSVGSEIDPDEHPIGWIRCHGMGNIDMSWWKEGWDCGGMEDADIIRDCCENGDVSGPLEDLRDKIIGRCEELAAERLRRAIEDE